MGEDNDGVGGRMHRGVSRRAFLRRASMAAGGLVLVARPGRLGGSPGAGAWVADVEGGVFSFGDARYAGSLPELVAAGVDPGGMPAGDIAAKPSGNGYWILDRRGGVFAFGGAPFAGHGPRAHPVDLALA